MAIKNRITCLSIFLIWAGIFIIPFTIRYQFFSPSLTVLYRVNSLAIFGLILLLFFNFNKSKSSYLCVILLLFSLIPCIFSMLKAENQRAIIISYICCCILPIMLLFIDFSKSDHHTFYHFLILLYDLIIVMMLVFAIGDHFFDRYFVKLLSQFCPSREEALIFAVYDDSQYKRFYSLWGHPLTNTVLFNIFFLINTLYNKYFKRIIPSFICFIIAFCGIAMTASKSGFCVLLGMMFLTFYNQLYIWIVGSIFLCIAFFSGMLNQVIFRLTNSPLDSNRNHFWLIAKADNTYPLHFLSGYGFETTYIYNSKIQGIKAAYEYPIRMFSLDNGILFALLILGIILGYTSYQLLKKKHIYIWLMYMLIFAEVNIYNGIALTIDCMLIFCFFTMIVLNISYSIPANEINWKGKVFKHEKKQSAK